MAAWMPEDGLSRLCRRLGAEADDERLMDALEDAALMLKLYLSRETLPDTMGGHAVRLAEVYYRRMTAEHSGMKAWNYSEGEQTQSETMLTGTDYEAEAAAILTSLASYRQVRVKGGGSDGTSEHTA